jgi:hypothetical protein
VLTTVTIGGLVAQTNSYTSGALTKIIDGNNNRIVAFAYDSATAGKVVRVDTSRGTVGFEYGPSRTGCSGAAYTMLYFNQGTATSCEVAPVRWTVRDYRSRGERVGPLVLHG